MVLSAVETVDDWQTLGELGEDAEQLSLETSSMGSLGLDSKGPSMWEEVESDLESSIRAASCFTGLSLLGEGVLSPKEEDSSKGSDALGCDCSRCLADRVGFVVEEHYSGFSRRRRICLRVVTLQLHGVLMIVGSGRSSLSPRTR